MKLFISPTYNGEDKGNHGGIRRVIDAQRSYFANNLVDHVEDADVVAIHAGSMVKVRTDQKVVAHCHGLYWKKYDWSPDAELAKDINGKVANVMHISDFITAPTEWVANSIRRDMYRPVTVVPHGVAEEWGPYGTNMGYVLWNKSREDKVCDAKPVYEVARLLPDIQFRMTVGSSLLPNVTITGLTPYSDRAPVANAGVYLATAQETFGIGLLEALACGVPVVGWNWGGQAEIVPQEWLVREGDYQALADKIQWALRANLSAQCIDIASRYTWEAACQKYEEVYARKLSTTKRVSVVIRNYNTGKFLGDAVDSALAQLGLDDEIVIVDDCSTEPVNLDQYAVNQVRIVTTPKNLHLAGAMNYGIEHAQGRYILPLDADNMLAPNGLNLMVDALEADRSIDIAYGRINWLSDKPVKTDWPPSQFTLKYQLSHKNQIPCTSMYRRQVFTTCGPYRNRCRVAEDADFWCRATSLGFVPKQVTTAETFIYRVRAGTTSSTEKDWPWEKWYGEPQLGITHESYSCEPTLVSVIIPVGPGHNLLLQDALDSLYMQTFKNWECIVINDTGRLLDWTPPWCKVIDTAGSVGPSQARNIGLEVAQGGLWLALDADDYLIGTTALETMLSAWRKMPEYYVYSDYRHGNGEVKQTTPRPCDVVKVGMPHILTGLYPILKDVRFEDRIAEDWDFVLQMNAAGYCGIHIGEPLVFYRSESGTRRKAFTEADRTSLLAKWGNQDMAGCSKCAQKAKLLQMNNIAPPDPNSDSVVLVTYIGGEAKRYFTGDISGRTYTFGTQNGLKQKYVLADDIETFKRRPDRFLV